MQQDITPCRVSTHRTTVVFAPAHVVKVILPPDTSSTVDTPSYGPPPTWFPVGTSSVTLIVLVILLVTVRVLVTLDTFPYCVTS